MWGNPLSITISQQGSMLYKTIYINKEHERKEKENAVKVCKYLHNFGIKQRQKFVVYYYKRKVILSDGKLKFYVYFINCK